MAMNAPPEMDRQKTLYVGNLSHATTEEFLMYLFGQIGVCKGCKIIKEPAQEPYAFIEFESHEIAQTALQTMNKRQVMGRELKVNWASQPTSQQRMDTSKHFHIFVGDLSNEIDNNELRTAFEPFGQISDVKIIKDPHTGKSKGYGFVSYVRKDDAENAIQSMHGQWIGSRAIRTNWATRKPASAYPVRQLNYEEVWNQASDSNCTVYVGNILENLTEQIIRQYFMEFGQILEIRIFPDKGFAFVKYDSKEAACQAICQMHGQEVSGYNVKCSWGREGEPQQNRPFGGPGDMGPMGASGAGMAPRNGMPPAGYNNGSEYAHASAHGAGAPAAGDYSHPGGAGPAGAAMHPYSSPQYHQMYQQYYQYYQAMQQYYQQTGGAPASAGGPQAGWPQNPGAPQPAAPTSGYDGYPTGNQAAPPGAGGYGAPPRS